MCRSGKGNPRQNNQVNAVENNDEGELPLHQVTTSLNANKGIKVTVEYAGKPLEMEVDTGAAVSIISEHQFNQNLSHLKLTKPREKG